MMQEYIEKAKVLCEALPYIKEFNGYTVVIRYGGSALIYDDIKASILQDIALMKYVGFRPIVVHGGGPEINKLLTTFGITPEFYKGLRVTDEATMEVVEMALNGKINKSLAADLCRYGVLAVGISGRDANMTRVKKLMPDGRDIGLVGEVDKIDTTLIKTLVNNDFVPVISPVGADAEGRSYNVNADYAAVAIAGALKAEKLVFLTDIEGVRRDANDAKSVMARIKTAEVKDMIASGAISGGMIPKVECCVAGVNAGVKNVHILDGRVEHCLLLEIFTQTGIGTLVEK